MARPTIQSSDWDYQVRTIKLMKPDGTWSGLYGNEREDTGIVFNDAVTERYGLIQNKQLMDAALAALEARGLTDYAKRVIIADGGAKMYAEFIFQNKQIANSVGDVFGYKLTLKNSFDRTLRQSFELGFLRLVCLNGASTLEKEFSATKKHSKGATMEFIGSAIDAALNRGPNAMKIFDELATRTVQDAQGRLILANLEAKGMLSGTLRESIETLWLNPSRKEDTARNLYNLYNAVTEHLTHKVAVERYAYAQKTSSSILLTLVNAARKPEAFSRLILPIPSDKTVIVASGPIIDV